MLTRGIPCSEGAFRAFVRRFSMPISHGIAIGGMRCAFPPYSSCGTPWIGNRHMPDYIRAFVPGGIFFTVNLLEPVKHGHVGRVADWPYSRQRPSGMASMPLRSSPRVSTDRYSDSPGRSANQRIALGCGWRFFSSDMALVSINQLKARPRASGLDQAETPDHPPRTAASAA